MKKIFIKDDEGKEIEVNLDEFINHINKFHKICKTNYEN